MTSESINRYRWQLKNYHWKDKIRELIKSNPLFSDFDDILFEDISIGLIKWNKIVSCFVYYNQCRNRIIYVISTSISIQLWYLNILRSFLNLRDPRFFFFFFQDDIFNAVTKNKRVTLLTLNIDKTGKNIIYRWI